ncbi:U3 small nucleolar RNA-associated protein 6 homolog [Candoia aspera]|uniref:U3 small nucleolar RNA-associated protein 6 homolog n=1 Tax=Candoia aspera TaxID=51853 RepID=UPI002FD876A2
MAERIEQRIEDRIPELEQLERVGLFTRKEVRAVIKKVSALEYKIQRRVLHKKDFISYIQYEINLLELIKTRRLRIGYSFKKEEIEYSIVQRIHGIFKRATAKWKEDLQLWLSHVAFCKKWNKKIQLSKVFSSMLALHPNKPALWIMAAKWEMEDRLSSESARQLFLRALRFHPESPKLYQEYFRMELMHAEKQRKEKKEFEQAKIDLGEFSFSEDILNAELARIVYRNAIQKIKGAEFALSLLSIAKLFDFTQDLQKEILEHLQAAYDNDPLVWDFMGRRELEMESLPSSEYKSKQSKALEVARKEEQCCTVFEEAVTHLPTEEMWKCYVTFSLERYNRKTNSEDLRQKRLERVLNVFSRAHESQLLPASLYKQWIQLLLELSHQDKAKEVAAAATNHFSQLVDMWEMRLQLLLTLKSSEMAACSQEAFKVVKAKDTLPLWILWLEWSESVSSKAETEALYQRSLLAIVPADSVALKEKYLEWAHRTGGYKKAKQVFTSLRECRPFSLQFFKKMIQIEKEQESSKIFNIREFYERALREFGATEPDLWLDYIKEELNHSQGKPENCGSIHWRAMKTLQGEQVETFISKYTLLQAGHL